MINQYLPDYEALPNLKNCQIKEIEANGRKIKYFDELVIDVTKFKHPGSTAIL